MTTDSVCIPVPGCGILSIMNINLHNGIHEQAGASRERLADAQVLYAASRWRGAMYLAGYAIECLLKAKLMQIYDCRTLRELELELKRRSLLPAHRTVFTHQLETLLSLAPGAHRLTQNHELARAFRNVNQWAPQWRYNPRQVNSAEAARFMSHVDKVMHWINTNI